MKVKNWPPEPNEDEVINSNDPRRTGVYRSIDEAQLGGVLAGFAHKWGLNRLGMRIVVVLVAILSNVFSLFIVAIYFILWMVLPKRKTKPDALELSS